MIGQGHRVIGQGHRVIGQGHRHRVIGQGHRVIGLGSGMQVGAKVTAKHACTLRVWLCVEVYTERVETAAVLCGTSHASAVSTPLRWIKNAL